MAKPTLNYPRAAAEVTGQALLDTLHSTSEASVTNPIEIGSRFLIELRARGLTLISTTSGDGIFRRDITLRVAP